MKLQFLSLCVFMALSVVNYAQTFEWAGHMGSSQEAVYSQGGLAADFNGNSFLTGHFSGTVDIDPSAGEVLLTATNIDAFVSKVSPEGNLLWAAKIGGDLFTWGVDVATTPDGGVVTVGHFVGTVDFDPGAGVQNITATGDQDIFVLKISASGQFQWVKTYSTTSDFSQPYCHSVTVDPMGNIAVAGEYNGVMILSSESGTLALSSINGERDYFLMHLSSSGDWNWARSIGSDNFEGANGNARCDVAMGQDGSVFMIGELKGSVEFDSSPGGTLEPDGDQDVFMARYNADGTLNWVQKIGAPEVAGWTEMPTMGSVAVGPDNKVYFASRVADEVNLSDNVAIGMLFSYTSFVAQYEIDGTVNWGRTITTDISGIAVDAAGFLYCTGYTGNNENMDYAFSNTTATVSGFFAMPYLIRFNSNGDFNSLIVYDAPSAITSQFGFGVAAGGGSVYTSGQLRNITNFNVGGSSGLLTPFIVTGQPETYLVRHSSAIPECASATLPELSADGNTTICFGESITISLSGNLNNNTLWNWTSGDDCFGTVVGNGTSVTLSPNQSGSYSVSGIGGGCQPGPCASIDVVVEVCTNISDLDDQSAYIVYSNDRNVLRVINKELVWLSVVDVSGRQVIAPKRVSNSAEVDLNHLPPGVYIAVLWNDSMEKKVLRFVR
jgi:hypothetical protein